MLFNYLKITLRNIKKSKGFSFINISGLSIGLACFIFISMWVLDELSYDKFHKNIKRIYRINTVLADGRNITNSSLRLGEELKLKYTDIESYTNFIPWARSLVKYQDKVFDERGIYLVDSAFFTIFSFDFIKGDPSAVLKDRYSIVITDETAHKYFGENDPIGKNLYSDVFQRDFKVTAVVKKMPSNSSLQFNLAARIDLMPEQRRQSWEFSGWTYLLLKENVSEASFNNKIKNFYTEYVDENWEAQPKLQSYSSLHLFENGETGLIKLVYIFSSVAVFLLLIAIINFTNLSTARAAKRAKEVGVRKVNGAQKKQLIIQFLSESITVSFFSILCSAILIELFLPLFNNFAGKSLELFGSNSHMPIWGLIILALISGILAGAYPAFVLSKFKPAAVLKENSFLRKNGFMFRKVLTIGQFSIATGLIVFTLIVSDQMDYIQSKDIGMDRERILTTANNPNLMQKFDTYKEELKQLPNIENVTASATRPFDVNQSIGINWEGHMEEESRSMAYTMVDYDFLSTMEMSLINGRTFSPKFVNDTTEACLINETAANIMGFENPIGKSLYFEHPAFPEEKRHLKIIGVVKDFHSKSLHNAIGPFVFKMYRPWHFNIFIKLKPENLSESINQIKTITKKFAPDYPFEYAFLDDLYNDLYLVETKTATIFKVFAGLAIIVSCLGLLGLATFTAEQKTKEIGIRKTLGSTITNIVFMLSKQFAAWIIIANIIAWPITYYLIDIWLQNFEYRIETGFEPFVIAGFFTLIISLITIGYLTIKAALANPVDSLRYE